MGERVSSHACARVARLLSGHTKLERNLAGDLLDARAEWNEAIEAIKLLVERAAHIIGTHPTWTNENTNTGVVEAALGYLERFMSDAARAAEGDGDGESRLERIRRLIEEQYIECPTGCGASFEELLCYELHDGGLTFRALAQKWNIGLPTLGSLIADHCERL